MNKEEFLQALRRDLSGDVPPSVVEENVQYYREYIEGEVEKGRSEEDVIGEIGTPRLIAKNIEDTTDMPEDEEYGSEYAGPGYGETYSDPGGSGRTDPGSRRSFHLFNFGKWYGWVALLLVVFLVLYVVFSIVSGIFMVLAPILVPVLLVWLIVSIIFGPRRR